MEATDKPAIWKRRPMVIGAACVVVVALVAVIIGVTLGSSSLPTFAGLGYDVSYPQCPRFDAGNPVTLTAGEPTFLVIGLGGGRPFTTNRCLVAEWKWAERSYPGATDSLYFNTGYDAAYLSLITPHCAASSDSSLNYAPTGSSTTPEANKKAWQLGCSEAQYAIDVAAKDGLHPFYYWADVEIENSWSLNAVLDRYVVDGLSWRMHNGPGAIGGGFYSPNNDWNTVIGAGIGPTPSAPRWASGALPHRQIPTKCGNVVDAKGFAAMSINQGTVVSGIDTNWGCG